MEISENLFKDFVANIAIVNSSRVECTPMIGQIGLGESGGVTPSPG